MTWRAIAISAWPCTEEGSGGGGGSSKEEDGDSKGLSKTAMEERVRKSLAADKGGGGGGGGDEDPEKEPPKGMSQNMRQLLNLLTVTGGVKGSVAVGLGAIPFVVGPGPGACCPPLLPTHLAPSSLALNGTP